VGHRGADRNCMRKLPAHGVACYRSEPRPQSRSMRFSSTASYAAHCLKSMTTSIRCATQSCW
jgi:hypothetical protein